MNTLVVILVLGYASMALCDNKTCQFPHVGNGGILDGKNYVKDSVLVWIDIANEAKPYADDDGKSILNSWIDATEKYNVAMEAKDEDAAFKLLHQANDSFKTVAPHINNPVLQAYFLLVNTEFGALLLPNNLPAINAYMLTAYPIFKQKLGCVLPVKVPVKVPAKVPLHWVI